MTAQLSQHDIFKKVSVHIAEALAINPTEIKMESRLFNDFGAESIDIVDIRFRIEQEFDFKVAQDEFIRCLGEGLSYVEIQDKFTVASLVDFIENRLHQTSGA